MSAATLVLDGLRFDRALFGEPTATQLSALGYDGLTVYIKAAGGWSADTGRLVIEPSALSIAEMGTLTVEASANGLTDQTLAALQSASGNFPQVLEEMGSVTVDGLKLSFRDNGLTDRLLDSLGQSSGADRTTLIAQVTGALEVSVAAIGDADFTAEVHGRDAHLPRRAR